MNKNGLRQTLGSIHASDELVASTIAKIEARKHGSEARGGFGFGAGFRVALAACAFMLVIGLGIYGAITNPPIDADDEIDAVRAAEASCFETTEETENSHGLGESTEKLGALLSESENIDGDWVIISGVAEACFFAGGEDASDKNTCIITVAVDGVEYTFGGIAPAGNEISLTVSFENESEMMSFIDNSSEKAYFLITPDDKGGDTTLRVKKFIFE